MSNPRAERSATTCPQTRLVHRIMAHEEGSLSAVDTLDLFADLIRSGLAWNLQGSYGRLAARLIELGHITDDGHVTTSGAFFAEHADEEY